MPDDLPPPANDLVPTAPADRHHLQMVSPRPLFPIHIKIGDVQAVLHADGTAEGDGDAFREALAQLTAYPCDGLHAAFLWLVARALPPSQPTRS